MVISPSTQVPKQQGIRPKYDTLNVFSPQKIRLKPHYLGIWTLNVLLFLYVILEVAFRVWV